MFLPSRSSAEAMSESGPTTIALHSGWASTSTVRSGEPLARASSAAAPAVELKSTTSPRSSSLAGADPAENSQVTVTSSPTASSSQPCSLSTRLAGL